MTLRNGGGAGDRGRRGNDGEKSRLSRWAVIAAIPLLIVLVSILAWPGTLRPDRPAGEKAASSESGQTAVKEAALQKETAPGSVEPPLPDLEDLERPLAERITELRQRPAQLDVLAAAHAEQGNFEAAVQVAGRALYLLSSPRGEAGASSRSSIWISTAR